MNKPDARTRPQEVQKSLREQAIRLHEQDKSWQEISEIINGQLRFRTILKGLNYCQQPRRVAVMNITIDYRKLGPEAQEQTRRLAIKRIIEKGESVDAVAKSLNTDRFIGFLGGLIKDTVSKTFLIVDNLRMHHAIKVREWLEQEDRSKKLELLFLPPYSPMLNPDEYFNRDLKTNLRLGPVTRTATAIRNKAEAFMAMLAATPERVRSCFACKQVAYAA